MRRGRRNPSRPKQRGAVEWESGIGGEMVRTKRSKAERVGGKGAARVAELADQALQEACSTMVEILKTSALTGRESSVRLLVTLANGAQPADEPEAKDGGFSQALLWESEPPWMEELNEAEGETAVWQP